MIIEKRLKRLKKVTQTYLQYTKWKEVNVFIEDDSVFVMWVKPKIIKAKGGENDSFYIDFTYRVFPATDLNKKNRSYRDKIIVEQAKAKEEKE